MNGPMAGERMEFELFSHLGMHCFFLYSAFWSIDCGNGVATISFELTFKWRFAPEPCGNGRC